MQLKILYLFFSSNSCFSFFLGGEGGGVGVSCGQDQSSTDLLRELHLQTHAVCLQSPKYYGF